MVPPGDSRSRNQSRCCANEAGAGPEPWYRGSVAGPVAGSPRKRRAKRTRFASDSLSRRMLRFISSIVAGPKMLGEGRRWLGSPAAAAVRRPDCRARSVRSFSGHSRKHAILSQRLTTIGYRCFPRGLELPPRSAPRVAPEYFPQSPDLSRRR
jgi:hypothetical protein